MAETADIAAVKAANLAYYKALSARDMRAMEKVWTCARDNILIAPPLDPVTHMGWAAIKRNWEKYWPQFSAFSVAMAKPTVNVNGPAAWVHGVEKSKRKTTRGKDSHSTNFGTNIFAKQDDGRWLMVFHQSTAMPD